MKLRLKITIIVTIIITAFIFLSNSVFSKFFSNYLEDQEEINNQSISKSVMSFFNERMNHYQTNVNDYSHWDDTYIFINTGDQAYIENNLFEDTFKNLQINFMVFVDANYKMIYKQYYDINNNEFLQFPQVLTRSITEILNASVSEQELSTIIKMGDQYYFISKAEITDSKKEKISNGTMVIGRLIDEGFIKNLEELTDSRLTFSLADLQAEQVDSDRIAAHPLKQSKNIKEIRMEYSFPNRVFKKFSVLLTLTKSRDLYANGIKQIQEFMGLYSIVMILVLVIIFFLLGIYISKPFIKLIDEVKGLDLSKNDIGKLKAIGNDEFAFLRDSVNNMLSRIEMEQYKVRENEEKLYATLLSVGDGVITVDRDGAVDFMNPVAQQLTGYTQAEAYGKSFESVFNIINEYTRDQLENPVEKVFKLEETVELANHTILISKDETERAIEDTASPIRDKNGKIIGVVLVFRDFSEKKEKRKQIEYLSYHDQLTGLYNRRFYEEELSRMDTLSNLPLSFLFADVNGLKTINDVFGHQYGDILLQEVAEVLNTECRADDIIARTGGDEFNILLPKTDSMAIEELAKRIKEKIEQKKIMDINISISLGWDTKTTIGQSAATVFKNAEDFMYQKKILDSSSKRSAVIKSILNILYLKSPREDAHSKRVSLLCEAIGRLYKLSDDEIKELGFAGELHDIGKIAIDEAILKKPGKLSQMEWAQIQRHPEIGYRLLGTSSEYYTIAEYVLAHHERWDGTGYPNGLKGEAIHWKARVISIADAFDAMTTDRPYKKGLSEEEAVEEIKKNAGTQFDPDIAKRFVDMIVGGR